MENVFIYNKTRYPTATNSTQKSVPYVIHIIKP